MACNICGSPDHEATTSGCSRYQLPCLRPHTGWLCPACGKGNAPDAMTCGHCAQAMITCRPAWGADDEIGKEADMYPGG